MIRERVVIEVMKFIQAGSKTVTSRNSEDLRPLRRVVRPASSAVLSSVHLRLTSRPHLNVNLG